MDSRMAATSWTPLLAFSLFMLLGFSQSKVPQEEEDALQKIVTTMGATYWKFNADNCSIEMVGITPEAPRGSENDVECECDSSNNTVCHVTKLILKRYNLPGVLPSELVNLPYIRNIDFAYNYLHGTIPSEWSSTQLTSISVITNRLSGEIPKELGNVTTLTSLNLEANNFSGAVPSELGKLTNLQTLFLSSNGFTGKLPTSFSRLMNLTDFRINDNNFTGPIPEFLQNWQKLARLEMHATGLQGPIPANISLLNNLSELRISDIAGPTQGFPLISNLTGIVRLYVESLS